MAGVTEQHMDLSAWHFCHILYTKSCLEQRSGHLVSTLICTMSVLCDATGISVAKGFHISHICLSTVYLCICLSIYHLSIYLAVVCLSIYLFACL